MNLIFKWLDNLLPRMVCLIVILLLATPTAFSAEGMNPSSLLKQAPDINPNFLNNALQMYSCAEKKGINKKKYLGIIDFTLSSNKKRLWIFDMEKQRLLYNTWVAHGKGSGELYAKQFSNLPNTHESSLGLYLTDNIYKGGHGTSLHLKGKEEGFNDNAYNRFIVMHGAWYVSDDFIKKYGRIGRSFGCPAVPESLVKSIIQILKEGSVLIAYYPDKKWINSSQFIACN